jgi:hypothetical protein
MSDTPKIHRPPSTMQRSDASVSDQQAVQKSINERDTAHRDMNQRVRDGEAIRKD